MVKKLPYIIIAILFGYIVFLHECKRPKDCDPELVVKDSVITDTIYRSDTVYIPKWHTRTETEYDTIKDTIFVFQDYNTKYFYSDVILNDFRGFISVYDTIYQNKIKSRRTQIKLNQRTVYYPVEIKRNKFELYYGGGVSGWADKFGFEAGLAARFKTGNIGSVTYDPINKSVKFVYFVKF